MGALLALLLAQAIGNTSPPGVVVQDEGTDQGRARKLNCVGAGITCSVSAGLGTLTVAGGGGSTTITQVTVNLGLLAVPSFTATITDAGVTGTSKIVAVQDGGAVGPGTISFVSGTSVDCGAGSGVCNATIATSAGNLIVVAIESIDNGNAVGAVVDSAGSAYTRLQRVANPTLASTLELWVAISSAASTSVSVVRSGTLNVVFSVAQYAGVGPRTQIATNVITAIQATATLSAAITRANNWLLTGFAVGATTPSASVGNLRTTSAGTGPTTALMDNTAGAPGTVTTTAALAASNASSAIGIEVDTGPKDADENELDPFTCSASPAAGSFILNCTAVGTLLTGRYRVNYLFQ